jgi:hypothetical protein
MPGVLRVELTSKQREELEHIRDHDVLPYMRERAFAILMIADGASGRDTALHRLHKPYLQDTIYKWVKRYRQEGIDGLIIKPGRGHKSAFQS